MKIGDEVYVHGYIDEIRNDVIIIRNDGGYFGTAPSEVADHEPTAEYSSDVISRQAAIDALHTRFKDGFDEDKWWNSTHVLAAIEGLPSAQPFTSEQIQTMQELEYAQIEKAYELGKADRPKGEWIKTEHCLTDNGYRKWIELECPFCDFRPVFELIDDMNFCPNCGADMRERNDG